MVANTLQYSLQKVIAKFSYKHINQVKLWL